MQENTGNGTRFEHRVTAHDPETMATIAVKRTTVGGFDEAMRAMRRKHRRAFIVLAKRTVDLSNTARVGSWQIVRSERPDVGFQRLSRPGCWTIPNG